MNFRLRLALRLPAVLFFLLTAWFGVLSYVPFAYLQFLRHQLFNWLAFFVTFHHYLYWGAVLMAALSISDDLAARRRFPWAVVIACLAYGLWLVGHPMLPALVADGRSLAVGLSALGVPFALALVDHVAVRGRVRWASFRWLSEASSPHLLALCVRSAALVWLAFALFALVRIRRAGDLVLSPGELGLASAFSVALHLTAAVAIFVFIRTSLAMTRSVGARYAAVIAGLSATGCLVLVRVIFSALAFRGATAYLVGAAFASVVAFVCSGLSLRQAVDRRSVPHDGSVAVTAALALVVAAAALSAVQLVEKVDWYFLLQEMIAFLLWIASFAIMKRHLGSRRAAAVVAGAGVLLAGAFVFASPRSFQARLALAVDRYAAFDPSLMLLQKTLEPGSAELADLTRFLVVNSNISEAHPSSVDFVSPVLPSTGRLPHIFVFVIDSLRRDYLSPYNAGVSFTPSIASFARESLVFRRAFTRYGGTGLSEPAVWSGALLPHKEYVMPFAPMNALEKLVEAERYHQLISVDSILRQLLSPSANRRELDAGIQNRLYDSCRTFEEIQRVLPETVRDGRPAFVFTQPQDVHLANVAVDRHPYSGNQYAGFYLPYAARLERLDRCFGSFVDALKTSGLYDNSVVVLTSDHGDSLGDEGRWGHAYTVFPEVIQVPLIMHVPDHLKRNLSVDTSAVAFTTDITPTLYTLVGHQIVNREPLFGASLAKTGPAVSETRRKRPYLVASSYGPVYGVLEQNGEVLYIVDAVNTAERRYDLTQGFNGRPTVITDTERARAAASMREQLEQLGAFYHVRTTH